LINSPELRDHCFRLLIISALFIIGGGVIARRPDPIGAFGWMSVAWSIVNALIALPGFLNSKIEPHKFGPFLAFNLGLNFAYIGVGVTMAWLGNPRVKGAGIAVAIQGVVLLVLDAILYQRTVGF
jgi:hypothetical protein